ncbi:phospho-N-acetylmuramoyl-pentapeptide-transferase [Candidatus Dependentiae bacterium]|nr:phospho-N-acetylmuramoyl-pentapeptide-transferase [Candidatus Dependentiae bacterium]
MLYYLGMKFVPFFSSFQVIHYISFRAIMALLTTFFMSVLLGRRFIAFSASAFQNTARPFTPENHQQKGSTPTMGGIFIIGISFLNIALWCDLTRQEPWILALSLILFGAIGLLDDISKVKFKKGISARLKFRLQLICAILVILFWIVLKNPSWVIYMPIFKELIMPVGVFFIPWLILVIVGTSNAVNLTDGLDGLAIGILITSFVFFGGVAYISGHIDFAHYLHMPYVGCSEAVIVAAVLTGACLGFYWFNAHPAEIFMGDVGSLSLGATLAMFAIITRQEMLLPIVGGVFVAEALSVILQIASIKIFKRRILRMSPLHHHFEVIGWRETKVTTRFHIITLILSLFAAVCLKLR